LQICQSQNTLLAPDLLLIIKFLKSKRSALLKNDNQNPSRGIFAEKR